MATDAEGLYAIANKDAQGLRADIVFVHGLVGGWSTTWRWGSESDSDRFFWPGILGRDLPDCAIWSMQYGAGITSWFGSPGMAIQERARNLVLKLLNRNVGQRDLIFIAHSMGGLEVKEIIVRSQTIGSADWKNLVSRIRGIVFCGTPHRGAHVASAAKVLANYLGLQEHVQQMRMGDSYLDTLHDEFLTWQRNSRLPVESYVEQVGLFRARPWLRPIRLGLVVTIETGNPNIVGCDCHPIAADHITLVKPRSITDDVYAGVLRFIHRALDVHAASVSTTAEATPVGGSPEFPPEHAGSRRRFKFVHKYILLDTQRGLIGRKSWTTKLNDWLTSESQPTTLVLQAIGGVGKSALAWAWFNSLNVRRDEDVIDGGFWYCFYETGASFKDFLNKLYEYVIDKSVTDGGDASVHLLERLTKERIVLVLDGLERILKAHRSEQNADPVQGDLRASPEFAGTRERDLCRTVDANAGAFLIAMSQKMRSRMLITSRLVPASLLNIAGKPRSAFVDTWPLDSLSPNEVIEMFAAYQVAGKSTTINRVTNRFGRHTLLVKLIAGMVANDAENPGDFDTWLEAHPTFEPTQIEVTENRVHVLDYSLRQLSSFEEAVLLHVAAFITSVTFEEVELLSRRNKSDYVSKEAVATALRKLDSLNLIEWDRKMKRYDLHPLVRNTVMHRASATTKQELDQRIIQEFQTMPSDDTSPDPLKLERQKDVFFAYVRLQRFEEAWRLYQRFFSGFAFDRFGDLELVVDLLSSLKAKDCPTSVPLYHRDDRCVYFLELGTALRLTGRLRDSIEMLEKHRTICPESVCQAHQALVLEEQGSLVASEHIFRHLIRVARENGRVRDEAAVLPLLADAERTRGLNALGPSLARLAQLYTSLSLSEVRHEIKRSFSIRCRYYIDAHCAGNRAAITKAERVAVRALRLSDKSQDKRDRVNALSMLSEIAFARQDWENAQVRSVEAGELAQRAGLHTRYVSSAVSAAAAEFELGRLGGLAERLDQLAEIARDIRSNGTLSKIRYLQARLSRALGDVRAGAVFAQDAYVLAWCDGPPFTMADALARAESLLKELVGDTPKGLLSKELPPDWTEVELPTSHEHTEPQRGSKHSWDTMSAEEAAQILYVPSEVDNFERCEVDALLDRSRECFDAEAFTDAIAFADLAIWRDSWGADCYLARGKARWYSGFLEEAAQDYERAAFIISNIARESLDPELLNARGQIYALMGRAAESLRDLDALLADYPDDAYALNGKSLALALVEQHAESDETFTRAVLIAPGNAWAWFYRGRALALRNCRSHASEAFSKSLELSDPSVPLWMRAEAQEFLENAGRGE